jgi:Sec7-like guanine-nucleotide exchange factor
MTKYLRIFSIILFLLLLIGCNLSKTTTSRNTSNSTTSVSTETITNSTTTTTTEITTTVTTEIMTTTVTTAPTTVPTTTNVEQNQPFQPEGYSLLDDELEYVGIPSTGDVKILVFAVDFSADCTMMTQ